MFLQISADLLPVCTCRSPPFFETAGFLFENWNLYNSEDYRRFHIWKITMIYIIANCRRLYIEELWQLAFLQIYIKILKK
jgi:hypothetical protein